MLAALLRAVLALSLFAGTLLPMAGGGADWCLAAALSSEGPSQELGHEEEEDCQDCAPDCLCVCCPVRCASVAYVAPQPMVGEPGRVELPVPSDGVFRLSTADIFHPPRA